MHLMLKSMLIPSLPFISQAATAQPEYKVVLLTERQMRERATVQVLPRYPARNRKDVAEGVVVAFVEVDPSGAVTKVRIIQSPNPASGMATESALKKWKFTPVVTSDGTRGAKGKLTFYFYFRGGKGVVENPRMVEKLRSGTS